MANVGLLYSTAWNLPEIRKSNCKTVLLNNYNLYTNISKDDKLTLFAKSKNLSISCFFFGLHTTCETKKVGQITLSAHRLMSPTPQIYPQLHLVQYIIVSDTYRHLVSNGTIPITRTPCIQLVNTGYCGKLFYFYDNLMSPFNKVL